MAEKFLRNPSLEQVVKLKDVRRAMRKANIIKIIAEHMVDNDIFEEDILAQLSRNSRIDVNINRIRKGQNNNQGRGKKSWNQAGIQEVRT